MERPRTNLNSLEKTLLAIGLSTILFPAICHLCSNSAQNDGNGLVWEVDSFYFAWRPTHLYIKGFGEHFRAEIEGGDFKIIYRDGNNEPYCEIVTDKFPPQIICDVTYKWD